MGCWGLKRRAWKGHDINEPIVLPDFRKAISFWLVIFMLWVAESRGKPGTEHPSKIGVKPPDFFHHVQLSCDFFVGANSIAFKRNQNSRHFWEFLEVLIFLKDISWPNPNQEEVEDWRVTDFQGDLTRKAVASSCGESGWVEVESGSDEPEFCCRKIYLSRKLTNDNRKLQP